MQRSLEQIRKDIFTAYRGDMQEEQAIASIVSIRINEENQLIYNKVIEGLVGLGYSISEAKEAIERFCSQDE